MKTKLWLSVCVVLVVLVISQTSAAFSRENMEGRTGVNIQVGLDDNTTLIFDEEFRIGNDRDDYYLHTEIGVEYAALNWLDVGVFLRQIFEEQGGDWTKEFRPRVEVTPGWFWSHIIGLKVQLMF